MWLDHYFSAGAIETFRLPLTDLPAEVTLSMGGETISIKHNNKPELFVPVEKKGTCKSISGYIMFFLKLCKNKLIKAF